MQISILNNTLLIQDDRIKYTHIVHGICILNTVHVFYGVEKKCLISFNFWANGRIVLVMTTCLALATEIYHLDESKSSSAFPTIMTFRNVSTGSNYIISFYFRTT